MYEHTQRKFTDWFDGFKKSLDNSYRQRIDFDKVYKNAEKLKIEIYLLNSLIGSKDIENDFIRIIKEYPKCLQVIPVLLAIRNNKLYCCDVNGEFNYNFKNINQSAEQYAYFMRETGLFDLIQNHIISNLYDYIMGVEVGMDTNGRKNRTGDQMEDLVMSYLIKANATYYKEMTSTDIQKKWNIDLNPILGQGISIKRFDFVIKTPSCIYGIETNFYTTRGSKLNETARSYKLLAEHSKNIKNFKFVWITDGPGWKCAKHNLEETFNELENIYNIADLEQGAIEHLIQ